jgi:hypothetical protein
VTETVRGLTRGWGRQGLFRRTTLGTRAGEGGEASIVLPPYRRNRQSATNNPQTDNMGLTVGWATDS